MNPFLTLLYQVNDVVVYQNDRQKKPSIDGLIFIQLLFEFLWSFEGLVWTMEMFWT